MTVIEALLDTNVFVYAWTKGEVEKHKIAINLIDSVWKQEIRYAVSVQNLAEFTSVLLTKGKVPADPLEIARFIRIIETFSHWSILSYDAGTIARSLEIHSAYDLHFWDALLVATMEVHKIHRIITEDSHLKKVPWLEVINPFRIEMTD